MYGHTKTELLQWAEDVWKKAKHKVKHGNDHTFERNGYILRDKDGLFFVEMGTKPYKLGDVWACPGQTYIHKMDDDKFPGVQWEDDEPTTGIMVIRAEK